MRPIDEIIIHCSATQPQWMAGQSAIAKVVEIDRWHRANGWSGIGYHFVIDRDGTLVPGRDLGKVGAHVKGHNTGTIGVCLLGGHGSAETDAFADNFTPEQGAALNKQIAELKRMFPAINKVSGHAEYAAKACPGFNVGDWLGSTPIQLRSNSDPAPGKSPFAGLIAAILAFLKGLAK